MTVKEVKEMYKNEKIADIEVYKDVGGRHNFSTDNVENCEEYNENDNVITQDLFNEKDYNDNLFANADNTVNFTDLYGDKNAKVLCILIDKERT